MENRCWKTTKKAEEDLEQEVKELIEHYLANRFTENHLYDKIKINIDFIQQYPTNICTSGSWFTVERKNRRLSDCEQHRRCAYNQE